MAHTRVKTADEVLGDKFKVLDQGYVRRVDYMGGDDRIIDVARRHYGNAMPQEKAEAIDYVVDRMNIDALGMVEIKFHFEMPIAEAMTFVYEPRANVNEFSLRYSEAQDIFHNLSVDDIVSAGNRDVLERLVEEEKRFSRDSFERYSWARSPGINVAKEIARATLGSNLHTRFYWKINLADLLDFAVRTNEEQPSKETMQYVKTMLWIAYRVAPLAVDSYLDNADLSYLIEEKEPDERIEPKLGHEISLNAEDLLDKKIPVLGGGYVALVDYMGAGMSVLNAARVSTGKDEKPRSEAEDKGLINYLMRHRHTTPSEMIEFLWEMRLPIFVYRQGGRHRTFERVILDGETSPDNLSFYHPRLEDIAAQSVKNHQGRGDIVHEQLARDFLRKLEENENQAVELYRKMLAAGVSQGTARRHLPVNRFITWTFKTDLHNALHYLGLRLDSHAQLEIREPSEAMAAGVKAVAPWSYAAFEEYKLNGISLSATEITILGEIMQGKTVEHVLPEGWLRRREDGTLKPHREREEFVAKLSNLGFQVDLK